MLEAVWSALEDAGIPPQSLAGCNSAVYMGVNSDGYGKLLLEDLPRVEHPMGIGTEYCGVPNRVSYILDLQGPNTAVNAACASFLVIHRGRMSLLSGETNVAIVMMMMILVLRPIAGMNQTIYLNRLLPMTLTSRRVYRRAKLRNYI